MAKLSILIDNPKRKVGRPPGFHLTDQEKARLSEFWTGKKRPYNSERMKGHTFNNGREHSEATKEKHRLQMLGNTYRKGTKLTDEDKLKISQALKGRIISKETIIKRRETVKKNGHHQAGRPLKEETKIKLSISLSGQNNPNWRGGISTEPYCIEWNCIKEYVKERDNNVCMNPFCHKTHFKIYVHHINYTKNQCGPDNLISLCNSCNTRANFKRDRWQHLYQFIMNNFYGYSYV